MKQTTAFLLLHVWLNSATAYLAPHSLGKNRRSTTSWRLGAVEPTDSGAHDMKEELRGASFKTSNADSNNIDGGGLLGDSSSDTRTEGTAPPQRARTGTVNERLMAELQEAADKEKYGTRSELTKKFSLDMFQSTKTDEERKAAIEEARNLNGVNPVVTGVASVVALAAALGLWQATTALGVFFATHPVESDWYVVQRSSAVFRNVVVGLVSLGAGFCGVTGLGILLLTGRVAAGVAKGELDPTPLPSKPGEKEVELPNIWDLMLNKKPNRRSGGKDMFGP